MRRAKMTPEEICWKTGNFSDDCLCSKCEHQMDCSGSDYNDEDEDEDDY